MTRHPEPFLLWFYIEKYSKIKFFVFTFFLHSAARAAHRRPRCAFSPLSRPLPHPFLHSSHLDSILGVLFTASVFPKSRPPLLFLYFPSPAAPSITHSLLLTSPSACLPSLCLSLLCFSSGSPLIKPPCLLPPCPVSTHTSHTSLLSLFVSYLCPSFSLHISITTLCILPPYSCLISFYYAVAYTLKWCLISGLKWIAFWNWHSNATAVYKVKSDLAVVLFLYKRSNNTFWMCKLLYIVTKNTIKGKVIWKKLNSATYSQRADRETREVS